MKSFLSTILAILLVIFVGCGHNPVAPEKSWLPSSFSQADSLYNALGTTMFPCTANGSFGQLSVVISQKTVSGKIADVTIAYGGKKILRDSVSTTDTRGIDVLINHDFEVQNIAVVQGDKNYAGNAMLRKLIVNGDTVSGIYPFGEAKLFNNHDVISFQYISTGMMPGLSTLRYVVYDIASDSIVCQFDRP
jgi:hypothetical protein